MLLILILNFIINFDSKANCQVSICLKVQNESAYNGPDYMGVGMAYLK
jgi:hypothetical protein